jgi:hypothetical protein
VAELALASHEVVLVAAVGVAGGVGVVLEQVDVADHAVVAQAPLRVDQQTLEHPLAGLVVRDELDRVVALGGRVLGVAAHVEVQARPVAQEDVAAAPPGDDPAEEVARDLVGAQRRCPLNVHVTPYSFSIPKILRSTRPA